jgi:hypothetical protein
MFSPGPSLKGEAFAGGKSFYGGDLESGPEALYPGITVSEQGLRWGFIQKVRARAAVRALRGFCSWSERTPRARHSLGHRANA